MLATVSFAVASIMISSVGTPLTLAWLHSTYYLSCDEYVRYFGKACLCDPIIIFVPPFISSKFYEELQAVLDIAVRAAAAAGLGNGPSLLARRAARGRRQRLLRRPGGGPSHPDDPSAAAWRSPLLARPNDDDDDEESNLPDNEEGDWRTFRAKLVMSEGGTGTAASAASSSALVPSASGIGDGTAVIADDLDLDGFGALFSDAKISGFTPLSPSQWAYDSGKVVERGAVILGGVEQDFGFGLRQQYFHKAVILVLDHDENTFTKGIILNRPSDR